MMLKASDETTAAISDKHIKKYIPQHSDKEAQITRISPDFRSQGCSLQTASCRVRHNGPSLQKKGEKNQTHGDERCFGGQQHTEEEYSSIRETEEEELQQLQESKRH